jgi:hypothetical protein
MTRSNPGTLSHCDVSFAAAAEPTAASQPATAFLTAAAAIPSSVSPS